MNEDNSYTNDNMNTSGEISQHTDGNEPGKGAAIASLVLGIISIVFWFFGAGAIVGIVTGIIGLICSANAGKAGYEGGLRKGGFVCSLIGLIGSGIALIACVACVGAIGTAGLLDSLN